MKSLIITSILILTSFIGFSQNNTYAKLDSFFNILQEKELFFGSVAVTKGKDVIYANALGAADLENNKLNNTETEFRIGSISKTFTATLIMKAVELDKLKLDDNIEHYFPNIQNASSITIRQLLNHRSGISNFTDRNYHTWHTKPITQAALVDTIIGKGIDFEPDADFAYSNSNYVLLSMILEKTFKKSYEKILDKYIASPLNLQNTHYGAAINTANNEAKSYYRKDDWKEHPQDDMSIPLGAGGIISTPIDLCLFARALMNGQLISAKSVAQMKPVDDAKFGFALYATPFNDSKGWGHGGNIDAFASNLIYFEEEDICFAMSCNGANFGSHDVELAVLNEIFGRPYELPSFDNVSLSEEELDQYVGTYVTDDLPMDMIVTKEDHTLYLMATGQSRTALEAKGNHKFIIMKYGVKLQFLTEENKLLFEQQGHKFEMLKQEVAPQKEEVKTVAFSVENLDKYVGTYSSDSLPIDLTISQENNQLIGQGEGQPSFRLSSEGDHKYSNKEIGLTITFIPEEKKMNFMQGGASFEMSLEE